MVEAGEDVDRLRAPLADDPPCALQLGEVVRGGGEDLASRVGQVWSELVSETIRILGHLGAPLAQPGRARATSAGQLGGRDAGGHPSASAADETAAAAFPIHTDSDRRDRTCRTPPPAFPSHRSRRAAGQGRAGSGQFGPAWPSPCPASAPRATGGWCPGVSADDRAGTPATRCA